MYLRIRALQPAERLSVLCDVNWHLPKKRQSLERLLQNPKEADFWQADHFVPVAEGGGNCGLENFRTLCSPCHLNETEQLRARLQLKDNVKGSEHSPNMAKKSKDLRDFFVSSSLPSKKRKQYK